MGSGLGILKEPPNFVPAQNIDQQGLDAMLDFRNIVDNCLPKCVQSWKGILTDEIAREMNNASEQSFMLRIIFNTRVMDKSGFIEKMLGRGSKKRGKQLTLIMIRFVFGMKGRSEHTVSVFD